ncbi:putative ankyrin repeat protein [Acanthamoeba castellanii mimivirus]|uniref:Putative ankyrin repeat protein R597 n=5 Tax=Mimivirus TaxID=315393 RepID=YR597_MIMIV|nr:putative ankyrin repeat protein [Acanthamoeba polyphaga mimivirus]Q5UP66.1 RecName: Full=Putative ankyrin repeat protein R597 [Acanthamoeba polyphaga mimivirus]AHA45248.1 putative ankyrin repeat protein [Hirudovirus strain Sangsue]ALR84185.1 ankyrin repeat protein [Niemeyer virus]AMK61962.1 ankyrin repeat protein [Samba virus]AMZ03040.1 putative ankyrin repeat protein [Mimivirus Bombay]BAV61712.1 putative ankyrin repeat protein [Acanthamoeba castellanii mimivirus]
MSVNDNINHNKKLLEKYVIEDDLYNFTQLINEVSCDDEFGYKLTTIATQEASINIIKYVFDTDIIKCFPKHQMLRYAVGLPSLGYFTKNKDEFHNSLELMKLLLQYDMNNNDFPISEYLYNAVKQNNFEKVKLLIDNGINSLKIISRYHFENKYIYNNHEIVKYMIDNGVDIQGFNLSYALHSCIISDNNDGVEYYFNIGANINDLDLESVVTIIKYNRIQKLFDYSYNFNKLDYLLDNEENNNYDEALNMLVELTSIKTKNVCVLLSLIMSKY